MVALIQKLLVENNCVVLPNFGAFIGNYLPAEIRLSEQKILPPNKTIAFNKSLQNNDGLLTNAYALRENIPYKEAEERVIAFIKECNATLDQNKSLIFPNIGKFSIDNEKNIQFQPYFENNYWLESIGLPTMALTPIQRLKDSDTQSIVQENYQRILHPELMQDAVTPKNRIFTIPNWIATTLAITLVTATLSWNIRKIAPLNISYSSILPVSIFKQQKLAQKKILISAEKIIPKDSITQIQETAVITPEVSKAIQPTEEVKPVVLTVKPANVVSILPKVFKPSFSKSYIVVGAFLDSTNAKKYRNEVEQNGHISIISHDYNNVLFRVSIEVENKNLDSSLLSIRTTVNQRAWVYCSKCNL